MVLFPYVFFLPISPSYRFGNKQSCAWYYSHIFFLANLSILVVWKQYIFILRRTRNMSCYMLEDVSMHVVFRVLVLKLYINQYMKSYRKLSCAASAEIYKWSTWARLIQAKTGLMSWVNILNNIFKMRKNFLILKRKKRKDCLKSQVQGFGNQINTRRPSKKKTRAQSIPDRGTQVCGVVPPDRW